MSRSPGAYYGRTAVTFEEFAQTLPAGPTPSNLRPLLLALWHDAAGNWDEAHRVAQDVDTEDGAWVHAYLHRKEGDGGNAAYWYRRAGRPVCLTPLDAEWESIVRALLAN